jgi:hypothetical protein
MEFPRTEPGKRCGHILASYDALCQRAGLEGQYDADFHTTQAGMFEEAAVLADVMVLATNPIKTAFSTLNMDVTCFSETSFEWQWTMRRHIPQDTTFGDNSFEKFRKKN